MPIYTVGHSNHTLEAFLVLLRLHQIEVLIDTRSTPCSRFAPQFNKAALKASVLEQGIKYGFYGRELGGRPERNEFYDARGHVLYEEVAQSPLFQEGLARLIAGAGKHRIALLCSEEDPNFCHRRLLVARVLDKLGVDVAHIRGDGRLEAERELQAVEARLEAERQVRSEETRLALERKSQAEEARRTAKRELREEAARQKLRHQMEAVTARLDKQRMRQAKLIRQIADRSQRAAERKALKDEARLRPPRVNKSRQKVVQPRLFDTEEM